MLKKVQLPVHPSFPPPIMIILKLGPPTELCFIFRGATASKNPCFHIILRWSVIIPAPFNHRSARNNSFISLRQLANTPHKSWVDNASLQEGGCRIQFPTGGETNRTSIDAVVFFHYFVLCEEQRQSQHNRSDDSEDYHPHRCYGEVVRWGLNNDKIKRDWMQ